MKYDPRFLLLLTSVSDANDVNRHVKDLKDKLITCGPRYIGQEASFWAADYLAYGFQDLQRLCITIISRAHETHRRQNQRH